MAIISSYLRKIGEDRLVSPLIAGSMGGVLLSMLTGLLIYAFYTVAQVGELIEAISSFIAVLVLTSVIYWMNKKGGRIKQEIEMKTKEAVEKRSVLPIAILGFIVVFREGVETVLFTLPLIFAEPWNTVIGVSSGISFSVVLAYLIFKGGMKLSLKKFFQLTSLLLIFIASGILGYGVHELIEYGEEKGWNLGLLAEPAYVLPIGEDNPFHHKGVIGSILAALFGYAVKMEWLRVIFQFSYLAIGIALIAYTQRIKR